MEAPSPALRPHRAAIIAVIVAALAVTALAALGIASLLGWLPDRQKAAFIAPDARRGANEPAPRAPRDLLAPITGGKHPEPLMPRYSQPEPPPPAPNFEPEPQPLPRAAREALAPAPVITPAPQPRFAEPAPAPANPAPRTPSYAGAAAPRACDECGRVVGIAYRGQMYEVRVRFDDGTSQLFRYRNRPQFEPGDRVRFDGSFLDPD